MRPRRSRQAPGAASSSAAASSLSVEGLRTRSPGLRAASATGEGRRLRATAGHSVRASVDRDHVVLVVTARRDGTANSGVPMNTTRTNPSPRGDARCWSGPASRPGRRLPGIVAARTCARRDRSVDDQQTVQVVDLVLKQPGKKPLGLDSNRSAVQSECLARDLAGAVDGHGDAGNGQATLLVGQALVAALDDLRVAQSDESLAVLVEVVDDDSLHDADLSCGKADTRSLVHGAGPSRRHRSCRVSSLAGSTSCGSNAKRRAGVCQRHPSGLLYLRLSGITARPCARPADSLDGHIIPARHVARASTRSQLEEIDGVDVDRDRHVSWRRDRLKRRRREAERARSPQAP